MCNAKWQDFYNMLVLTVPLQQYLISSICVLIKQDFQALLSDTKPITKGGKKKRTQKKRDFFWYHLENVIFEITVLYK